MFDVFVNKDKISYCLKTVLVHSKTIVVTLLKFLCSWNYRSAVCCLVCIVMEEKDTKSSTESVSPVRDLLKRNPKVPMQRLWPKRSERWKWLVTNPVTRNTKAHSYQSVNKVWHRTKVTDYYYSIRLHLFKLWFRVRVSDCSYSNRSIFPSTQYSLRKVNKVCTQKFC